MNAFLMHEARDQQPAIMDFDRTPFEVLITAVSTDSLLRCLDLADLPHFGAGPCWTVQSEEELKADRDFELAIVLCSEAAHLAASASLSHRLTARRITTVRLLPATLDHFVFVPGFLTILAPGDLAQGISMLAHTLLAPVQQDGIVCCDWVDILDTLADGARAQLLCAEAPSAGEAVRALAERLAPFATGEGYGAIAALDINEASSIRDWYAFRRVVAVTAQQHGMVLASAPVNKRGASKATAMVLTAPSSRYFRYPVRSVAGA